MESFPLNRRSFLQQASTLTVYSALNPPLTGASRDAPKTTLADLPQPMAAQKRWMELKFGMFVHFGINTYYDTEWSDGTLDPVRFNPTELDTDQWCRAAKAAGMNYIVLITKHHDGFCLWPTRQTAYSVLATPFKRDVLGQAVESSRRYGLKVGFYYSLWDRHEHSHDTDEWAYVEFMKRQFHELLTGYGDIVELWFDGFWKKQQSGWTSKAAINGEVIAADGRANRNEAFIQAWRNEGAYRWQMDHLYQYIKSIQPNCLVMNNSTTAYPGVPLHPVDIRSGEKYTAAVADQKIWPWRGRDTFLPMQIETTLSTKSSSQFPSGNWFWHEWDHSVASTGQVKEWLRVAGQMQANLLVNVGPMATGKLRPEDEQVLLSL